MSHVCDETASVLRSCRTSAAVLTKKQLPYRSRPCINREVRDLLFGTAQLSLEKKTCCKTPLSLRILTKHMVRLRRCSSCGMDRTSAAPLLVISETFLFLS